MAPRTLEEMLAAVEALAHQMQNDADPAGTITSDPALAIADAFRRLVAAQQSLADRVADGRAGGLSWSAIGTVLGLSGEAARQRYSRNSPSTP